MLPDAATLAHRLLDLFYPPLCLHCGAALDDPGSGAPPPLCRPCREDCVPIRLLACKRCGLPAASGRDAGPGPCAECLESPPPYAVARSAFLYRESGPLRSVLLRLKHAADLTVAQELAEAMLPPALDAAAILRQPRLCPVPLHWLRRMRRGYNQAELLARHLARRSGLPLALPLRRPRATLPQKGTRLERQAAMQSAFRVRHAVPVHGLDFLLVDDVLTTGATAGACAQTLLDAGARAVGVVTLARVSVDARP